MTEDERELEWLKTTLKAALPPCEDLAPTVDLWPRMLRRLEERPVRFGYLEALIVGLLMLVLALFPELIPMLLYHL